MPVRTEQRGPVGILTLDRPQKAHAYDRAHLQSLASGFEALSQRADVIVVQSTGDGAFCGGADLSQLGKADPLDALDLFSQRVFNDIARSPVVSIAAVHGPAVAGGCELTLACDLRIAGPNATFHLPETALGIIPSAGGCTRLTHLLGASRAKQVILGGKRVDAQTALQWGLVMELCEDPRGRAVELGQLVAKRDAVAQRLAKQIIDRGEERASLEAERVSEALLYARKAARAAKADG